MLLRTQGIAVLNLVECGHVANSISIKLELALCAAAGAWLQGSSLMPLQTKAGLSHDPSHVISQGKQT